MTWMIGSLALQVFKDNFVMLWFCIGRMIDMVKIKATNLQRVTFLVLDEADRMFDMGFGIESIATLIPIDLLSYSIQFILEPQVRSICNHTRPERQTLLFSATFKKRIEKLARDVLIDPIRIVQVSLKKKFVKRKALIFLVLDQWICYFKNSGN